MSKKEFSISGILKEKLIQRMLDKHAEVDSNNIRSINDSYVPSTNIPKAWYRFEDFPMYQQICLQKAAAKELNIPNPFFRLQDGIATDTSSIGGISYITFGSYNYLGLNGNLEVSKAAKDAIDCYGTSVSGSRITSGERQIHRDLEAEIAKVHGTDDCVVFVSGHATNVTTIGYLFGPNDLILYDALSHNSIVQGVLLSGAHRKIFQHNNFQEVDDFLTEQRAKFERVLIVIEGLYSMDGDFPNLPEFIQVKERHHALLMVDEAHSLGVLGKDGSGIASHFGVNPRDIDICMGTLSKSLASAGGYIAGSKALVEILRTYAPGFFYSVGLAPAAAASALMALKIMQREPQRVALLRRNGLLFLQKAREKGINTGLSEGYAVVPVIVGSSIKAGRLADILFKRGIIAQPIFHPAVEERSARLRFFICSQHTEEQIIQTIDILNEELNKLK